MAEDNQIKLLNVRLSFPDLWTAKAVKPGDDPKFGAHLLLDKKEHADQIKSLKQEIAKMAKEKWGDTAVDLIKKGKIHIGLHEGSEKDYDGYGEGNMYVSANSNKRPLVIDRDKGVLTEADRRPYSGCYVNAIIRLWIQDNSWGKRVNAELLGVQFAKDGEPFGSAPLSEDAFEALEEPNRDRGGGKKGKTHAPAEDPDEDEIPF